MAKVPIKWNLPWFDQTRNSKEAQDICLRQAERVASGLKGYKVDVQPGQHRCHAMVKTDRYASRLDNATNNTLAKALGATNVEH